MNVAQSTKTPVSSKEKTKFHSPTINHPPHNQYPDTETPLIERNFPLIV